MTVLRQAGASGNKHLFDLRDRGLLLADGVFDTSLLMNGSILNREAHLARLLRDTTALEIPADATEISSLIDEAIGDERTGVVRVTITRGPMARGLARTGAAKPTLLVNVSPLQTGQQFGPISLMVSDIRRNSTSATSRHKTLAYTDNVLAQRAAQAVGYSDALFLNEAGQVCCTSIGNLFLKLEGDWVTPPLEDGVLPGTMRAWGLDAAESLGISIREESVSGEALPEVEAAFMTNSIRLIAPITRIGERDLPGSAPDGLLRAARSLLGAGS